MNINIFVGIIIPLVGTLLGSALVYIMKKPTMNKNIERILLGFAAGVMVAASVWSLINPSIEMSINQGKIAWLPASIGFILGILFLLGLDNLIPHLHLHSNEPEGTRAEMKKTTMMLLAVTLHNIPEGMAVGVALAGAIDGSISIASAIALSIGIAIQNFPEGSIVSMPLRSEGMSKNKAFSCGVLSGIVEPIGAIITILLTSLVVPILPYLLSFAAGAMIYVVIEELIPEAMEGEHSNIATIGFSIGFIVMMILDVALS